MDTFSQHEKILLKSQCQSSSIVPRVLKKGRIESADEYDALLYRVEELLRKSEVSDDVIRYNNLLAEFVQSQRGREDSGACPTSRRTGDV